MRPLLSTLLLGFLLGSLPVRGQWLTQTLELKAGWNAVFLHVDADHATLDQLVGAAAPVTTPIEQIWRWNPSPVTGQFVVSPQQPVDGGNQWTSWSRAEGAGSALQRITGNGAYLVYSTTDYVWQLKGNPVLPRYEWTSSGLNFLGFPTVTEQPASFEEFLGDAPALQVGEIFRYGGGEFGPDNPSRIVALRRTPVRRGEAFWLRAGGVFNDYYGPFEVTASGAEMGLGTSLSVFSFRVRNQTDQDLTVTLRLLPSEASPAGLEPIRGLPPLLLRGELNRTNLTHGFLEFGADQPRSWTLAPRGQPGAEAEIVLGLDRARLSGQEGDLFAGLLQLTDSKRHIRVDLGVSARVAPTTGLWVGTASVKEVSQYLQTYLLDAERRPLVQPDGTYAVTGLTTNVAAVPTAFPLRLIVHNSASGPATLLQRVYYGVDRTTNPVVATQEAALAPQRLADARRISAAHLPWSAANAGWTFDGPLVRGGTVTAVVTNAFNDHASNPFLHSYHPDHDNLDARFQNELSPGAESYAVVREVRLRAGAPADDFSSRVNAGLNLTGGYEETISLLGLARGGGGSDVRRYVVRGDFKLTRLAEIPTLTRVP